MGQVEQYGEYVFGHRRGAIRDEITDGDTALPGVVEVNVIGAGSSQADELYRIRFPEDITIEMGFVCEYDLGAANPVNTLAGISFVEHLQLGQSFLKRRKIEVGRSKSSVIKKDAFHRHSGMLLRGNSTMTDEFWKRKSLAEMSSGEWESLCDGCALCCLQKLEDEETGEVFYSDIACRLLDVETCRCSDYERRLSLVSDCLKLSVDDQEAFSWLPPTCAYRRLAEDKDIPEWHPLLTGDPESVHEAGISMKGKAVSELEQTEYTVLRSMVSDDD